MKIPNLIHNYIDDMTNQYMILHPESDEKIVKEKVLKIVKEKIVNPKAKFGGESTSLLGIINMIEKENPIITGYGTMFMQHEQKKSIEWYMVDDFTILRNKNKKKKFEHINDKDRTQFNMYDIFQLTFKLLNNSYYGATNEPNSFFYHPLIGPTITQTGVIIITTAVNLFEKAVTNNFYFRRFTDLMIYVSNILSEDYDIEDYVDKYVSLKKFKKYLLSHFKNPSDYIKEKVEELCNNLSKSERTKIYYKNNFYEFMDNSEDFRNLLIEILGNECFLDCNELYKNDKDGKVIYDYRDNLTKIWEIFNKVIHYNYLDFYRYENARYGKRKTVLTIDTDSNFIYTYPFFVYCQKIIEFPDNASTRITTTNIIMYILSSLIAECYEMLTKSFNINEQDKRKIIKMKNEFFYSRIMLTKAKKNYGGIVKCQEGKLYENPKLDIKGLPIKKVSTNKIIREEFTKILREDILESNSISASKVFRDYQRVQKRIEKSLQSGSTEFAIPGKVNDESSYVNPMQQQTMRGSILWNALFPDEMINFPDKINFIKLNVSDLSEDKNAYDYDIIEQIVLNDKTLDDDEKTRICDVIKKTVFDDEVFAHYGFKIICFPKSLKKLPSWLVPMIDIKKMVEDNLKAGDKIIESVNSKVLDYQVGDNKGSTMSNIIVNI